MTIPDGYDIMVLGNAQSNTQGRGVGPYSQGDISYDNLIFTIGRGGVHDGQVIPMGTWLPFPGGNNGLHGYGMSLARYYAANLLVAPRKLLVLPEAVGGTSVLQWDGTVTSDLYSNQMTRLAIALNAGSASGYYNYVTCVAANLGETDVSIIGDIDHEWHSLMPDVATWHTHMLGLIDKFRSDATIDMPYSMGLFAPKWNGTQHPATKTAVEGAIRTIATERSLIRVMDTENVPDNKDADPTQTRLHFCAQGQEMNAVRHFDNIYIMMNGISFDPFTAESNGDFANWSHGTGFSINPNTAVETADNWVVYRNSGEATVFQSGGLLGLGYSFTMQRNFGTSHTQYMQAFQQIPSVDVLIFAGKKVTVAFDCAVGADWASNNGNFRWTMYTSAVPDDTFDYHNLVFSTPTTASSNVSNSPNRIPMRYSATFNVPADAKSMVIRPSWSPIGTAGADDGATIGNVKFILGIVPI